MSCLPYNHNYGLACYFFFLSSLTVIQGCATIGTIAQNHDENKAKLGVAGACEVVLDVLRTIWNSLIAGVKVISLIQYRLVVN